MLDVYGRFMLDYSLSVQGKKLSVEIQPLPKYMLGLLLGLRV